MRAMHAWVCVAALAGHPGAVEAGRTPRARVAADPATLEVGAVRPGETVAVTVHLVNRGAAAATRLECAGPGFRFPAVDVPALGAADVTGSYTAPAPPRLRKASPFSANLRCDRAKIRLRGRLVPCDGATCLGVRIEGAAVAHQYAAVTFTITVENHGTVAIPGVIVRATIPEGLSYEGRTEATNMRWAVGEVAPGGRHQIAFTPRAERAGTFELNAEVLVGGDVASRATTSCRVPGRPTVAISTYDDPDPVPVGKETTYVIEVRNAGTAPCTNIRLSSEPSGELEVTSATGPAAGPSVVREGKATFEPWPLLAPEATIIYKIRVKALSAGTARHRSVLRYDQFDFPILDEEATTIAPE